MGLFAVGVALRRRGLSASGLAGTALLALWVFADASARDLHGIAAGAALIAISLAAIRYAPRLLDERALTAGDLLGAILFVGPTLFAGWEAAFLPGTLLVFVEIWLLLGVGLVFRR